MAQTAATNRRFVLASRPKGAPTPANFRLEHTSVPEPGDGQVLLRTVYLSLDPYMRGRMSDAKSYVMGGKTFTPASADRGYKRHLYRTEVRLNNPAGRRSS